MRPAERLRRWRELSIVSSIFPSVRLSDGERQTVVSQRHWITRDEFIRFVCEVANFIPDLHSEIVSDLKIKPEFAIQKEIPRNRDAVVFDRIAVADVFTGNPHAEPAEHIIVDRQTDRGPDIPRFQGNIDQLLIIRGISSSRTEFFPGVQQRIVAAEFEPSAGECPSVFDLKAS